MDIAILGPARTTVTAPFAGGVEMHTHLLAEGLSARGHDVTVFAAGGEGNFRLERLQPVERHADDRSRRDLCAHPIAERSEHESYREAMLRLSTRRFDLVHINTVHYVPFTHAAMLAGAVTGTLHSTPYPRLAHALSTAAARAAPVAVAAVSATNARAWHAHIPEHRTILNGVDLRRWRVGSGGGGAVWSGRIVPEKAPHLAIAAAKIAGIELDIFGPAHDDEYFRRFIAPELSSTIRYRGHGSVREVAAALGAAGVAVVSPMWDEPFGLVAAEAMACGTPVAAFARGAMHEIVQRDVGVLAAPGDVDALAAAMRSASLLDRQACRLGAERRFGLDRMVDEYERWFEEELLQTRRLRQSVSTSAGAGTTGPCSLS